VLPKEIGAALLQKLQVNDEDSRDAIRLIERFRDTPGAHVLVSEGDGEVKLLVPLVPSLEGELRGPKEIRLFGPNGEPLSLRTVASRDIAIEGQLSLREYVLTPLKLRKELREKLGDAGAAKVGLRGEGGDEPWAPLGFSDVGCFWSDLAEMVKLASDGGIQVVTDPAGLCAGAQKGVELVTEPVAKGLSGDAKNALATAIGAEGLTAGAYPEPLLLLAHRTLRETHAAEAALIQSKRRNEAVDGPLLDAALALAFGAEFASDRKPTMRLVNEILKHKGTELGAVAEFDLRKLYNELEHQQQIELWGADAVEKQADTSTADRALKQLFTQLHRGTGLDEGNVFRIASRVQTAVNAPKAKPAVFILAGKEGGGVETLERRLTEATEAHQTAVLGSELRGEDPWGVLIGRPDDNQAPAVLLRDAPKEGRRVISMRNTELVGTGAYADRRAPAQAAFWAGIADLQSTGKYRGYDPANNGASTMMEFPGSIIVIRDSRSAAEIKESMPPEVWKQLSRAVFDFGAPNVDASLAQIEDAVRAQLVETYGLKDASVELLPGARAFLREVLEAGADPAELVRRARDQMSDVLLASYYDEELGHKVRFELAHMPAFLVEESKKDWVRGAGDASVSLGNIFRMQHEQGEIVERPRLTARIEARADFVPESLVLAQYQVSARHDAALIDSLVLDKSRLREIAADNDKTIERLRFKLSSAATDVERMSILNKEAAGKIGTLEKLQADLNGRIDNLNARLATGKETAEKLQSQLETAVVEREQINGLLASERQNFNESMRSAADDLFNDAGDCFEAIAKATKRKDASQPRAMLEQFLVAGTIRACREALAMRQKDPRDLGLVLSKGREAVNKVRAWFQPTGNPRFDAVAELATSYIQASNNLGYRAEPSVLQFFYTCAELAIQRFDDTMLSSWKSLVTKASEAGGKEASFLAKTVTGAFPRGGSH
jgi:hypothetical protein